MNYCLIKNYDMQLVCIKENSEPETYQAGAGAPQK
jgi:hypothetical protein